MTEYKTNNSHQKRKTLLLLDGNAIVHRAYHAIPPLSTDDGTQTNAVYGFILTFFNVLEKFQPEYIIAAFDPPGKTFRHEIFPAYKAKRKATPEDLVPQFALVKEVMCALGVTIMEKDGFEADDVIGTIASRISKDVDVVIVTGDKDTLQLVNDHVRVFTMSRGLHDMVLYDRERVREKIGVTVEQIIDYKGLRGDASDNIPGVKGIGEKTAIDLLSDYNDLDHIYAHLDDIKESVQKKLRADKERAYLSRTLGKIHTDVPLSDIDMTQAQTRAMTFDDARPLFHKFGFNSLLKRFPKKNGSHSHDVGDDNSAERAVIVAEADVEGMCEEVAQKTVGVALDCDSTQLYGLALSDEHQMYYVPYTKKTKKTIAQYLANAKAPKVVYDLKTMKHQLHGHGIIPNGIVDDVLLQAYVVQQNKKFDLPALAFDVLGVVSDERKRNAQMSLLLRDTDAAIMTTCKYSYHIIRLRSYFCTKITEIIATQSESANIKTVLSTIEMPLINVLFDMERRGVTLDKQRMLKIATIIDTEIRSLTKEIYDHAGVTFNINSTQQLRTILFEKLGISARNIKKNKTGYSTASDELQKIRDMHPIVVAIERYRELFKLKTTYVDVLPTLTDRENRIHTTFNQAVTTTGRLSSSDPNLQNIPIRTEDGRRLREGFVAKEGSYFVSADYSQIDLRCVAHVSGDPELIAAFNDGVDIHTYTAAQVLGIAPEAVSKDQRRSAKELNFGLIYGMGQFGFARAAGIDAAQAKEFIAAYFAKFAGVSAYIENTKKDAMKKGYVETIFGRRRYVTEIQSKNFQLRSSGERMAINMPIQGLAADIMKLAMIAVDRYMHTTYEKDDVYAVLQIHDEIIFEVREQCLELFSVEVKKIMEHVCALTVPLVVDISHGKRWSDL